MATSQASPVYAEPEAMSHSPMPSPSIGGDSFQTAEGLNGEPSTSAAAAAGGAATPDATEGVRRRTGTTNKAVSIDPNTPDAGDRQDSRRTRTRSRPSVDPNAPLLQRMTTGLLTPERPVGKAPGWIASFKAAIFNSWINVLLLCIPVGWALHFVKAGGNEKISDTVVFVFCFISIMPLAGLLGFATEEVSMRLGQTLGGLVNATLGNVVELIVAIIALIKCEIAVVQSSLIGSMLSNLLLVLGMCFVAGGFKFSEQGMKETAAQLNSSLLLLSTVCILIPSAFHFAIGSGKTTKDLTTEQENADILSMSHGVAVILLFLYVCFLVFQMWSHASLYDDDDQSTSVRYSEDVKSGPRRLKNKVKKLARKSNDDEESTISTENKEAVPTAEGENAANAENDDDDEDEEVPQMNVPVTLIVMVVIAVLVGVTAEFLVDSINGMVASNPSLSAEWVGLILLPIVGNAAEHFTAVSVSVKDKLDLSISVAVGSSIQIALFVIPFVQCIAWWIHKPLTLLFDPFESLVLFFSVIVVNQTLADGRANWMEGLILIVLYLIMAISFWYYPGTEAPIACT